MRGAKGRLAAMLAIAGAIGCGSDGGGTPDAAPPDASVPDAAPCDLTRCGEDCVDTTTSTDHCGGCSQPCTPAQDCDQSCQCPEIALDAGDFLLAEMDDAMLAPTVLGIGIYPSGGPINALVVGFELDTPTTTDIDLSAGPPPFVAIGYDVDTASREFRSAYRAQSGTLNLTRACAAGVAGSVTGAAFVEVDPEAEPPTVIPDGCTANIESLAFDFGDPCPE